MSKKRKVPASPVSVPAAVAQGPTAASWDGWLAAHRVKALLALLVLALAVRGIYFHQLNRGPCVWQDRWDVTDMHYFDQWARAIAAGDWLSARVTPPQHTWQLALAKTYLASHPDEAAELARQGGAPEEVLWQQWCGGKRFYQEPVYPYLVALTYRVCGPDVRFVFAWQMVLGVLSTLLLYLVVRRHFGDLAATLAALLAALCGPLLYYELLLLRETLLVFEGFLLLYLADWALEREQPGRWLLVGLLCGVACLTKLTFAPFCVVLVAAWAWQKRRRPGRLALDAGAFLLGGALCLAPVAVRNVMVGAPALALPTGGIYAFIAGNAYGAQPEIGLRMDMNVCAQVVDRSHGSSLRAVWETFQSHPSLGSWTGLWWRKFTLVWQWYEVPNNSNFYYYGLHAPILRVLPVTFFLLAPLGLVGLALAARRFHATWRLYLLALVQFAPAFIVQPISRYRLPLLAALLPFAAWTVARLIAWARERRYGRLAGTLVAAGALLAWTGQPLNPGVSPIRSVDYSAPYLVYYSPRADEAEQAGNWAEAARLLGEFLALEPPNLAALGSSTPSPDAETAQLAAPYATVHRRYAAVLRQLGREPEALKEEARAAELEAAASNGRR